MHKVQKKEVGHMAEHRNDIEIEEQNDEIEIDLGRLIRSMWKSFLKLWWLVLALVVAGAAVFTLYQRIYNEPLYACTATFTVATGDESSGSYSFYYDSTTADQMSKTFPYILESSFFRNTLLEQLATDTLNGTITAETIEDSNVVTMRVESPSAEDARAILDAAIAVYPDTARFVLGDIQFNMLDEPTTPTEPFNQMGLKRSVAYGALGGLFLSVCILGVLALLRQTARDQDEMKEITSLRCLAAVPLVRLKARKNQKQQKISVLDERLPYGYRESMRSLKVRLERKMDGSGDKVLLITSTAAGEGKSTLAVNLARLMAADQKNVLLIDGDLRKPSDAVLLGIRGRYSLRSVLDEKKNSGELIGKSKKSGIYFLGGTKKTDQPAPVLSSKAVREFIALMREKMDYIIIDSPPCGIFQDASLLSEYADSILYVVKYDSVPKRRIREGIASLSGSRAGFTGYVFNEAPETGGAYGYGRYGYGYGYGRQKYGYGQRKYDEGTEETDDGNGVSQVRKAGESG